MGGCPLLSYFLFLCGTDRFVVRYWVEIVPRYLNLGKGEV